MPCPYVLCAADFVQVLAGVMQHTFGASTISALLFGLSACAGEAASSPQEASRDVVELITVVDQATALAQGIEVNAVLRQVDQGRDPVRWLIRFTDDAAATREITVTVPVEDVPSGQWEVVRPGMSKLTGHRSSGFSLDGLRVGPAAVVKAATEHWNDCPVRGLSLTGEEDQLTWYIFCNLPVGVVSGSMDGIVGEFMPSLAPPARVPPTATPDCNKEKSAQGCQSFFGHRDGLVDVGIGVRQGHESSLKLGGRQVHSPLQHAVEVPAIRGRVGLFDLV